LGTVTGESCGEGLPFVPLSLFSPPPSPPPFPSLTAYLHPYLTRILTPTLILTLALPPLRCVLDGFLDADSVRGVRAELSLLDADYKARETPEREWRGPQVAAPPFRPLRPPPTSLSLLFLLPPRPQASEIWVGRDGSGVGVQISAPAVRGDRVVWVCGGRARLAGETDAGAGDPVRGGDGRMPLVPCDASARRRTAAIKGRSAGGAPPRFPHLRTAVQRLDGLIAGLADRAVRRGGDAADGVDRRVPWLERAGVPDGGENSGGPAPMHGAGSLRSDVMAAVYPGNGARFRRHIDNTANDGRVLTAVLYLNPGWDPAHGGALRIHGRVEGGGDDNDCANGQDNDDGSSVGGGGGSGGSGCGSGCGGGPCDVFPEGGRVALFRSDTVAHEVRPTVGPRPRHAVTVWYYDPRRRAAAVRRAEADAAGAPAGAGAAGGGAGATPGADAKVQREAQTFLAAVLAGGAAGRVTGGDGPEGGELDPRTADDDPNPDADLLRRAASLSEGARGIALSVLGQGLRHITRDDLRALRERLARMGM